MGWTDDVRAGAFGCKMISVSELDRQFRLRIKHLALTHFRAGSVDEESVRWTLRARGIRGAGHLCHRRSQESAVGIEVREER